MIDTEHGPFIVLKDHRDAFEVKPFNERYVDYLDQYTYIVGDISAEKLRLKGFSEANYHEIPDFLMESAVPNAPYFIVKRVGDPPKRNIVKEEGEV
jgi:uncharacterized protein YutD